jgi:hypothetical protein
MIEAVIQYAMEQAIIGRRFTMEELFAHGTHQLVG